MTPEDGSTNAKWRVQDTILDRPGLVWSDLSMMITNISNAKAQLSALVERVLAGEEVIIGKAGKPVAKLVPYEAIGEPRQPGALKGQIVIADDFDSLPAELMEAFGMASE